MASEQLSEELLHRYADGDLSADEAAQVRAALQTSEDDAGRVEQLGRLHGLFEAAEPQLVAGLDSDALFARIERAIDESEGIGENDAHASEALPSMQRPKLQALPGGQRMSAPPSRPEAWRTAGPVAGILAVAAAFTLFFWSPSVPESARYEPDRNNPTDEGRVAVAENDTVPGKKGSEVVEVDFGVNTGTVFAVEGEAGEAIAVVWINDQM